MDRVWDLVLRSQILYLRFVILLHDQHSYLAVGLMITFQLIIKKEDLTK